MKEQSVKASFFLTGHFYRNPAYKRLLKTLKAGGHYLGAHSNEHLLYCDWTKRDSLLVTREQFQKDLQKNYAELKKLGISKNKARYFLPPYEWYNDTIAAWTKELGLQLVNYTPGTLSHADYTTPDARNYRSSATIFQSIEGYERHFPGLNGFILLMHMGTDKKRTDKFYQQLPALLQWLQQKNYKPVRIDDLLQKNK